MVCVRYEPRYCDFGADINRELSLIQCTELSPLASCLGYPPGPESVFLWPTHLVCWPRHISNGEAEQRWRQFGVSKVADVDLPIR